MKFGTILFLAVFYILAVLLRKRFPGFYRSIQLTVNIMTSILALICCTVLIYGLYQVLNSGVPGGDKLLFALLVLASVGAFVYMAASLWRRWLKQRKDDGKGV